MSDIQDRLNDAAARAWSKYMFANGDASSCEKILYIGTEEDRELSRTLRVQDWICSPSVHNRPRIFAGFTVHTVTDEHHIRAYVTSRKSIPL